MANSVLVPKQGVVSSPNFIGADPGSLEVGDNVRYAALAVLEPSRGLETASGSYGSLNDVSIASQAISFYVPVSPTTGESPPVGEEKVVFVQTFRRQSQHQRLWSKAATDRDSTYRDLGYCPQPFGTPSAPVQFGKDLYVSSTRGTLRVSSASNAEVAGQPYPLDISAFLASSGSTAVGPIDSPTWLPGGTAVAYRATVVSKDAYGRDIEGPPSTPYVITNLVCVLSSSLTRDSQGFVTASQDPSRPDLFQTFATGTLVRLDTSVSGSGGSFFASGSYRVVSNGLSAQFVYGDSGSIGSSSADVTFSVDRLAYVNVSIPLNMATSSFGSFVQVYRTTTASVTFGPPDDECLLVYTSPFLTTEQLVPPIVTVGVNIGAVKFWDICPEAGLGDPLYTNPNTGQGIGQSRVYPPIARDMTSFSDRMFWANVYGPQSLDVRVLGVGPTLGVQGGSGSFNGIGYDIEGDKILIGPTGSQEVYVATRDYSLSVSGLGNSFVAWTGSTPGFNTEITTKSLVKTVNTRETGSFYLRYTSGPEDEPGSFRIERRDQTSTSQFQVNVTRTGSWVPSLPPPGSVLKILSQNSRHPAGLAWSPLGIADGAPLANRLNVGSDAYPILRIMSTDEDMYVCKTDGTYYVSQTEPFTWTKLSSAKLVAPNSLARLGGSIYGLFDVGVCRLSNQKVTPVSTAIDDDLNDLLGTLGNRDVVPNDPDAAPQPLQFICGLGSDRDREYTLFIPDIFFASLNSSLFEGFTGAQAYVFNETNGAWTTRSGLAVVGAAVDPVTRTAWYSDSQPGLYNTLARERDSMTDEDFAMRSRALVVTSISGNVLQTTSGSYPAPERMDVVYISGSAPQRLLVTSRDGSQLTVLQAPTNWETLSGSAPLSGTFYPHVRSSVRFVPTIFGVPGSEKSLQRVTWLTRYDATVGASASFASERVRGGAEDASVVVDVPNLPFGQAPFGQQPFGQGSRRVRRVESVPKEVQDSCEPQFGLEIGQSFRGFKIIGLQVGAEADTDASRGG